MKSKKIGVPRAHITVRIDSDLVDLCRHIASKQSVSFSNVVETMVRVGLKSTYGVNQIHKTD